MDEHTHVTVTARAFSRPDENPTARFQPVEDLGTRAIAFDHYGGSNVLVSVPGLDADLSLDTQQLRAVLEMLVKITEPIPEKTLS